MGIDIHTFRLLQRLASEAPLGAALTIGRQSVDFAVPAGFTPPADPREAQYCEWVLRGLGASEASSFDFSDYESATHIGDLSQPIALGRTYDTVIDAGSLEHIFDVATAFRNLIGFTAIGGRIAHVLPVNNLSGHGFWQFSSDLIYALYSEQNGFADTSVWYASSINQHEWREIPSPKAGTRTEMVSLEPVILLSVTTKRRDVDALQVLQPFYDQAWSEGSEHLVSHQPSRLEWLRRMLPRGSFAQRLARNAFTIAGLGLGTSRYALRGKRFDRTTPGQTGSKRP